MTIRARYVRRREYERTDDSRRFLAWLASQAERLGVAARDVFVGLLVGMGMNARQVEWANLSHPVNVTLPVISGTPQVGLTLTVDKGGWSGKPNPNFSYQWMLGDETEISGEIGRAYTVTADALGKTVFARVTAINALGTATADSDPTIVIT